MQKFYLTISLNQNYEQIIHKESCLYLPNESDIAFLGLFEEGEMALNESRKIAQKTNGCFWCCRDIHSNKHLKII